MLYRATGRAYWNGPNTTLRFFLSAAVQGLATTLLVSVAGGPPVGPSTVDVSRTLAGLLAAVTALKLAHEAALFFHLRDRQHPDYRRTATILVRQLADWTSLRFAAGTFGGVALPLLIRHELGAGRHDGATLVFSVAVFVLVLFGELCERALFFMGVSAPRTGGVGSS
jgi:DMSO reductase anchor subunit